MNIEIVFYGDEILGVNLPEKVSLEVTEASPAVAGNTATNALKEVKLETGLVVKVPMFIEQGDRVVVLHGMENIIQEDRKI
jgi:elongation factor P